MKINTINNKIEDQRAKEEKATLDLYNRLRVRNDVQSIKKFASDPYKRFK